MKKEISLSDKEYFEIRIGKRIVKKQIFYSKGKIPVYSSNVSEPFGFLEETNESITDFKRDYVLWGIDGNFEFSVKHKGEQFAITDHCGAIKILDSAILPEYLIYQLELKKYEMGFDRTLRASLANMRTIVVDIPIKQNGSFDDKLQSELIKKYLFMKETRLDIESQIEELSETMIELDDNSSYKLVDATNIFNFPKTNSHVTKRLCQENSGDIPVYGCSQSEDSVLGHIKENVLGVKYFRDSLSWNRNGTVGRFFYRQGVFTTNEDQRVIEIKPNFKEHLVPKYLKYVLQNEVRKLGYGWSNKLGKTKMIDIKLKIPTDSKEEFNVNKQMEIAGKYERLYRTRDEIIQYLQSLRKIVVDI